MKKLTGFLLAILAIIIVSISFISCEEQETGVYMHNKKVSKLYWKESGQPEQLYATLEWEGNKVASISYYYQGVVIYKDEFIYEGERLVKTKDDHGQYAEYEYFAKRLIKTKYYTPDGVLEAEITYEYDGEKVSTITLNIHDQFDKMNNMIERGFLGQLLGDRGMKIVADKLANQIKGDDTVVLNLTHEGENLSLLSVERNGEDDGIFIYSNYDNHSNPSFNMCFFSTSLNLFFPQVFSKNNLGKSTTTYSNTADSYTTTYTYTYENNYPVTIERVEVGFGQTITTGYRIEYQ